ncbi:MAG TPA: hypothetical protein VIL20_14915 [Sandaracinaceae bacterium]
MRSALVFAVLLSAVPASAQDAPPPSGGALDPESYVALAADEDAQFTLGGFRRYLERIRASDAALYAALDPRLRDLEGRETAADAIFWTATGLSVAALVAAIPVYTELGEGVREEAAIGLVAGGLGAFVLGLVVQAIVRPGHQDLLLLIDRHDELVGRR